MRALLASPIQVVIEQRNIGTLFAHFPCLLVLFIPIYLMSKCQSIGRNALSNRELMILNLQTLEYIGMWTLLLKVIIGMSHSSAIKQGFIQYELDQMNEIENFEPLLLSESEISFFGDQSYVLMFMLLIIIIA